VARHRIGIIGLGMALKPHALALRDLAERVEVAAAFAPSAARRQAAADAWGFAPVDSIDRLLADRTTDAVTIQTPPWRHAGLVARAAARGGADPMAFTHEHHRRVLGRFLDAIDQYREPADRGRSAQHVQRLIDALLASAKRRGPVTV
jgi:predicted dehydrogenase